MALFPLDWDLQGAAMSPLFLFLCRRHLFLNSLLPSDFKFGISSLLNRLYFPLLNRRRHCSPIRLPRECLSQASPMKLKSRAPRASDGRASFYEAVRGVSTALYAKALKISGNNHWTHESFLIHLHLCLRCRDHLQFGSLPPRPATSL